MNQKLKLQLSLLTIATIATGGLIVGFGYNVRNNFTIQAPQQKTASLATATAPGSMAGQILGDSTSADPVSPVSFTSTSLVSSLEKVYVNPFPQASSGAESTSIAIGVVREFTQPTAIIEVYPRGYTYPIASLSNCASNGACHQFCEQLANIPLCAIFAQRQGYMKPDAIVAIGKITMALAGGEGSSTSQDTPRVLGASDAVSETVLPTNPYANAQFNYSNSVLSQYLAAAEGTGCDPLDLVCRAGVGQINPQVLNASTDIPYDDYNGGGYSGLPYDGGYYDGNNNQNATNSVQGCYSNIAQSITPIPVIGAPTTAKPVLTDYQAAQVSSQIQSCQQNYGQDVAGDATSQKQDAIGSMQSFQQCLAGSKNLAADLTKCTNQYIR